MNQGCGTTFSIGWSIPSRRGIPRDTGTMRRARTTRRRVFYGEWDGQRNKRVIIKIMGELASDAGTDISHVKKSIRRNVSWFPDGADRAKPGQDLLTTPLHRVPVCDLGDDLLLVVTHATNPGDWSHLRGRPGGIDVATRDKRTSIYAEVIDSRSGQLLAQQGPLKPSEAALPIHVFGRRMTDYQFELTPDEDNGVRVLRLRLEAK